MTFRLFLIWVVRSHDIMAHQAAGHPQDHTLHVLCARGSFWWRMQLRRFLQWRRPRHSQQPPLNLNSKLYQLGSRKSEIYIFVIFYSRKSVRSLTAQPVHISDPIFSLKMVERAYKNKNRREFIHCKRKLLGVGKEKYALNAHLRAVELLQKRKSLQTSYRLLNVSCDNSRPVKGSFYFACHVCTRKRKPLIKETVVMSCLRQGYD